MVVNSWYKEKTLFLFSWATFVLNDSFLGDITPKVIYFLTVNLYNKLTAGWEYFGSREASIGRYEIPGEKKSRHIASSFYMYRTTYAELLLTQCS